MYELKRKIGILLGDKKEVIKKSKVVRKILDNINLKNSQKRNVVVKNYGQEVLKIMYEECNKIGIDIWLDFGTLLGWYREKDFISFDMDMDFGAYYDDVEKFQVLKRNLLEKGFAYSREFVYDEEVVEESYSYHGLNIDIVFYKKQQKKKNLFSYLIVYGMDLNKKPINVEGYLEENTLVDLKNVEFKGVNVQVPENTEEYLQNYYGADFMTPIPNFDWKSSGLYVKLKDSTKCKAKVYNGEKS